MLFLRFEISLFWRIIDFILPPVAPPERILTQIPGMYFEET